jgi:hexosaminidase
MKLLILLLLFFLTVTIHPQEKMKPALMPVPSGIQWSNGQFNLDSTFTVSVTGNPHERMYPAATRMLRRLSGRTGLFFTQDFITPASRVDKPTLIINIASPGKVDVNMNETYTLTINSNSLNLEAQTDIGAIRGLETLLQLLSADKNGYYFPNVTVKDEPRFRWRGLMLDVARHWMPMDVVKRNILTEWLLLK